MQTRPRPPIDSIKPKKRHELDSGCDLDLASQQDDSDAPVDRSTDRDRR
jgi:hypothetical protein